jgi:uncharacterized protein YkwD
LFITPSYSPHKALSLTHQNLAMAQSVAQAEAAFMNETKLQDNHRGNIVNKTFASVGIAIAVGQDGTIYITEEFVQAQ